SGGNWYSYCSGNPIMFWDKMGLEYNSLRNLTDSVEKALDTKATISIYKGNITVGFYEDGYNYRGTFKCDGTAVIDGTTKKIADNVNGHLYMERTDFYDVMNIRQESSMTTQSNKGVIKKGVSLFTGFITGALVSTLIKDVKTGAVVGVIVNEATAKIIDYTMEDKGTYKKITIVGEVYNSETGLYESIVTKDDYKLGQNNGGNVYYRYSLTTEKDNYTYSKSIFDNSIY
ncbi:MAG: hypothetical protein ACLR9L_09480, partial [Lachnospirales bacterium]